MDGSIATLRQQRLKPMRYKVHTVVEPTGGVDGTLYRGAVREPLDIWTPAEAAGQKLGETAIIATSEEMSPAIVRDLVKGWCREHLGDDDVTFEQLDD